MIRRALLLTVLALALQLVLSILSFANTVVHTPGIVVQQPLELIFSFLSPVTLIAFLLLLYRELSGNSDAGRRQVFALAAALAMAIGLALTLWHLDLTGVALRSLSPEIRTQIKLPGPAARWVRAAVWIVLPTATWIAFLLTFWREAVPLGRHWTRRLAAVLCVIEAAKGIYHCSRLLSRLLYYIPDWGVRPISTAWNLIIWPAVLLAAWFAVPYFLFSVWRTLPAHDPAESERRFLSGPPHGTDAIA